MTHNEAIKMIQDSFDESSGGKWLGARCFDLKILEGHAETSLNLAKEGKYKDALRWSRRCVELEKKIGFENAPLWGDFNKIVTQVINELLKPS